MTHVKQQAIQYAKIYDRLLSFICPWDWCTEKRKQKESLGQMTCMHVVDFSDTETQLV